MNCMQMVLILKPGVTKSMIFHSINQVACSLHSRGLCDDDLFLCLSRCHLCKDFQHFSGLEMTLLHDGCKRRVPYNLSSSVCHSPYDSGDIVPDSGLYTKSSEQFPYWLFHSQATGGHRQETCYHYVMNVQ